MVSCVAFGQTREVGLRFVDRKGKTMKDIEGFVYLSSDIEGLKAIPRGGSLKVNAAPADTVNIILANRMLSIGLEDMDSMVIVMKNSRRLDGFRQNDRTDIMTAYGSVPLETNTQALAAVDMATINNYSSLADYMQARVPGVQISGDKILIRGVSSINSSTDPLVVVDGSPAGSFADVNSYLQPSDIEAITVDKMGSSYGVRGANGVIIIKTKSGNSKK